MEVATEAQVEELVGRYLQALHQLVEDNARIEEPAPAAAAPAPASVGAAGVGNGAAVGRGGAAVRIRSAARSKHDDELEDLR